MSFSTGIFYPEFEIVYVEATSGIRHIGDHISKYEGSDLALIGPNIPHLNFDYGVKTTVETVVVQMKEHFLGKDFFHCRRYNPSMTCLNGPATALRFMERLKQKPAKKLKQLTTQSHFDQLITLLQVFQLLAASDEYVSLKVRPIANASVLKEQQRLHKIYHYIETHYQANIQVHDVAKLSHLTTAAFCRYFKSQLT